MPPVLNGTLINYINDTHGFTLKTTIGSYTNEEPKLYKKLPKIKKIITDQIKKIVVMVWSDGTTTKTETHEEDVYNEEFGIMMCIIKKTFGNYTNYKNFIEDTVIKKIEI